MGSDKNHPPRHSRRFPDQPSRLYYRHAMPDEAGRAAGMIRHISAVTFAVSNMARCVEFYKKLGFELLYGGQNAAFSTLKAGEAFVNLVASPGYKHRWWGRAIFRVDHVDAHCRTLQSQGLMVDSPQDAAGASHSFTSPIRTGTSLASRNCFRCAHNWGDYRGQARGRQIRGELL
jgi:catechol 2,3-dioxygenase-like lactoylglutathione lyase family enzyme